MTYSMENVKLGAIQMDESTNKKWANPDIFSNKNFPFTNDNPLENYDLSSIQSYVQDVLSKATTGDAMLSAEIFETHQSVIAKIKIPSHLPPQNLRVWVSANHIKIEKSPEGKEQILNLPCSVDPNGKKTLYKKGILQIRIPKVKYKDRYHEVFF
jgi:HSP20 family molecular chaperone IbpA